MNGGFALPRIPMPNDLRRWAVLAAVALVGFSALYYFWFRDSSFVSVERVRFEGLTDDSSPGLVEALESAAHDMTTLHVQPKILEKAVEPYPLVESVRADGKFPHTLTIHVVERMPAAVIGEGKGAVAVSDDGTILHSVDGTDLDLPVLPLDSAPKGDRLGGTVLEQVRVLGAAPEGFRRFIESSSKGTGGVILSLDGGIELRFGNSESIEEKWQAAAAVLSDPQLQPLDYVDLRSPGRPAIGGYGYTPPPLEE